MAVAVIATDLPTQLIDYVELATNGRQLVDDYPVWMSLPRHLCFDGPSPWDA